MSREEVRAGEKRRERERCEVCGCVKWHRCPLTGNYSGPWHFIDCPNVPGGAELRKLNALDRVRWESEECVPKKQGQRILQAILCMMKAPDHKAMLASKAVILEELGRLKRKEGVSA